MSHGLTSHMKMWENVAAVVKKTEGLTALTNVLKYYMLEYNMMYH